MFDFKNFMMRLAVERPVFHSEADFQHAFAWELHQALETVAIRLERPIKLHGKTLHLDLLAQAANSMLAIELKYKTRKLAHEIAGETFQLTSQSATDIGRYDFIKDVCRLEAVMSELPCCTGLAILLTNDSAYWKPSSLSTVDADFRLSEGRVLHGTLNWTEGASAGTKHNREQPLNVSGRYHLDWSDYRDVSDNPYGKFRYLAVPVSKQVT